MTEIHFYCVFCGSGINADPEHAGRLCPCPQCFRPTPAPAATSVAPERWAPTYPSDIYSVEIKFPCPKCGVRLGSDAKNAGEPVYCPACESTIRCPSPLFLIEPQPEAPRTVIHLSREEMEFLAAPESPHGKAARHAS
jgi:hypothetical protein